MLGLSSDEAALLCSAFGADENKAHEFEHLLLCQQGDAHGIGKEGSFCVGLLSAAFLALMFVGRLKVDEQKKIAGMLAKGVRKSIKHGHDLESFLGKTPPVHDRQVDLSFHKKNMREAMRSWEQAGLADFTHPKLEVMFFETCTRIEEYEQLVEALAATRRHMYKKPALQQIIYFSACIEKMRGLYTHDYSTLLCSCCLRNGSKTTETV